ncbi:hypothetical protein [Mycolicibacterium rhodesiae]|nr:hypothetical protein [Mycolicibacterium rhodesiae]MCV7342969.1 hypothetical protein [Mycolicibacterium rhodesiae]
MTDATLRDFLAALETAVALGWQIVDAGTDLAQQRASVIRERLAELDDGA